ncbi:MAG: hypothetical protein QXV17_08365 [Candidatus Micrarchaeaceae archaeon]
MNLTGRKDGRETEDRGIKQSSYYSLIHNYSHFNDTVSHGTQRVKFIKQGVTTGRYRERIMDFEKSSRILKRLYFVKFRYKGKGVEESAKMVGVTKKFGYLWQDRWNCECFNGLVPKFRGSGPPLMNNEERKSLVSMLEMRGDWSTREVSVLIEEKFGVNIR